MTSVRRTRALGTGVLLAASALALAGCGSSPAEGTAEPGGGQVTVVASTNVYGDIARQIGGDKVRVTSFINDSSQDPHEYEAATRDRLALSRAAVVIENGGGYDDFVDTLLKAGRTEARVLNAVEISGKTAPAGGELNEHVWYDLPSVARLADRIATALGEADPGGASAFTANAAAFRERLKTLEGEVAALRSAHEGAGVAVTEPLPGYLLETAGLTDETPEEFAEAIEEGRDVPPRVLSDTLALVRDKKVKVLVLNAQTISPQTDQVQKAARESGVPVVPVTETLPPGRDYVGWMAATIAALRKALS